MAGLIASTAGAPWIGAVFIRLSCATCFAEPVEDAAAVEAVAAAEDAVAAAEDAVAAVEDAVAAVEDAAAVSASLSEVTRGIGFRPANVH